MPLYGELRFGVGLPAVEAMIYHLRPSIITHAAICDGELIIRDPDKQTQDINELSHDTENAHSKLKPIFNKEDEQTRLNKTSSAANEFRAIYNGYVVSFKSFGYSDEEAQVMAGRTIAIMMMINGLEGHFALPIINRALKGSKLSTANKSKTSNITGKLDKDYFESVYGKENVHQGGGNYKETKDNINNNQAAKQLPSMSTQTGKWMDTNTRFKVEGGQMTTQLGQGKGMEIFNNNIVHFEKVQ